MYDAISFSETIKSFTVKADSIIFATGWEPYEASGIEHLNYSKFPDVITNVEMERLAALNVPGKGRIKRPSDNSTPENIVFVQCAGSRDEKHLPYCSAVCCSVSLKQALNLREKLPDAKIKIYYIDLRVSGRNEDLLTKVKNDQNIKLVKGKVSGINEDVTTKKLMIEVEDILSGRKLKEAADLIVLATGMKPSTTDLEQLKSNEFGFLSELEQENGIYIAACAKKPMDVSSSIKDACGMALKAIQTTTADNCKQLTNTNKYQSE